MLASISFFVDGRAGNISFAFLSLSMVPLFFFFCFFFLLPPHPRAPLICKCVSYCRVPWMPMLELLTSEFLNVNVFFLFFLFLAYTVRRFEWTGMTHVYISNLIKKSFTILQTSNPKHGTCRRTHDNKTKQATRVFTHNTHTHPHPASVFVSLLLCPSALGIFTREFPAASTATRPWFRSKSRFALASRRTAASRRASG